MITEETNVLLEISDVEFSQWKHNPITAAFLKFLDDQVANWKEGAAELLVAGAFRLNDPHEDRNPDVLRGKILALRDLPRIELGAIQGFYGKEPPEEVTEHPEED